jgi:DNA-binding NtrC family response regulator
MRLPPLRERKEDVPLLVDHFMKRFSRETGRSQLRMRPEVLDALCAYHWPGNVRELENEIRMLVTFADDPISLDRLSERIRRSLAAPQEVATQEGLTGRVEALERSEIRRALEEAAGNKSKAAEILGISRFALQRKLEKYAMGPDGKPAAPGQLEGLADLANGTAHDVGEESDLAPPEGAAEEDGSRGAGTEPA